MTVFGISPDPVTTLHNWRMEEDFPYNMLSDPDHDVADLYGVWGEKSSFGKTYEGINRSHFIIDANGMLEDIQYKVSPQESIDEALRFLASS
jgi:peroxiredoxin Q/BCP